MWDPAFFGIKPEVTFKGGFPVYSEMGEANGSLMTCEPLKQRPRAGAIGSAKQAHSMTFVSPAAAEADVGSAYDLDTEVVPISGTRTVGKESMHYNSYCPDDIEIDPETFEVRVDGEVVTCEPSEELALTQRYML
jgi:urease subunit alpha